MSECTQYLPGEPQKVIVAIRTGRKRYGSWSTKRQDEYKYLTYHFYPGMDGKKLKRGDLVVVRGGVYSGYEGAVYRTRSRWKGYTYEVEKAPTRLALQRRARKFEVERDSLQRQLDEVCAELETARKRKPRKKKKS